MSGIVDLFAGPGGWDVAAQRLGMDPTGVEFDAAARQTRGEAGLMTLGTPDVCRVDLAELGDVEGLIASPPCQTFSMAGKGAGRAALDQVLLGIKRVAAGEAIPYGEYDDARTGLVLEPLRYALELEPEWLAWEQVPTVQPVWDACADVLRADGYSVWTGHLQAEQYGVPQTRKRSVLIASRCREMVKPPPTHSRFYPRSPAKLDDGVAKWVSMAEALGWHPSDRVISNYGTGGDPRNRGERTADLPSATVTSKIDRNVVLRSPQTIAGGPRAERSMDQPSVTVTSNFSRAMWQQGRNSGPGAERTPRDADEPSYTIRANGSGSHPSGVEWIGDSGKARVTVQEAAVLQSFPADYPWDGLATAPHVAQGLSVEGHLALAHELVGDSLQRGVHLSVFGAPGQDGKVLQAVVMLDAVDVVNDLLRLRPGDVAVLGSQRAASEDVAAVDAEVGYQLPALVRVERVTVEPPLLPVLGAEAASDGFAFAVRATWLRRIPGPGIRRTSTPDPLVVHEAQAVGGVLPVAVFDIAYAHGSSYRMTGNSKTKQYQQVGNAIPPLLAQHILSAVTGAQP